MPANYSLRPRGIDFVASLLFILTSIAPSSAVERTQIIVQWRMEDITWWLDIWWLENRIEDQSRGLYVVDGNDFGSETFNVFLYATEPNAAIHRVIELFEAGRLRPNMRIGVAYNYSQDRSNWEYQTAYPPNGGPFKLMDR